MAEVKPYRIIYTDCTKVGYPTGSHIEWAYDATDALVQFKVSKPPEDYNIRVITPAPEELSSVQFISDEKNV